MSDPKFSKIYIAPTNQRKPIHSDGFFLLVWYSDIGLEEAVVSAVFSCVMPIHVILCEQIRVFPKGREDKSMARVSTKENKNPYQTTREALKLTREAAGEVLETLSPERIEKIENDRTLPHPDEVMVMAQKYKQPSLCNYYCANQCPIGQQYVPEIKVKDLSQIILEMLASLNSMSKEKDRLIEITVDGRISGDELADFVAIQEQLEKISVAVETLQLWSERMLATGAIDPEQYHAYKQAMQER